MLWRPSSSDEDISRFLTGIFVPNHLTQCLLSKSPFQLADIIERSGARIVGGDNFWPGLDWPGWLSSCLWVIPRHSPSVRPLSYHTTTPLSSFIPTSFIISVPIIFSWGGWSPSSQGPASLPCSSLIEISHCCATLQTPTHLSWPASQNCQFFTIKNLPYLAKSWGESLTQNLNNPTE